MMRFVVVGTMRRGAVNPPEPLDETGQALAYWRWKQDEAMGARVEMELAAEAGVRDGFRLAENDWGAVWFERAASLSHKRPGAEPELIPTKRERLLALRRKAYLRLWSKRPRLREANAALRAQTE